MREQSTSAVTSGTGVGGGVEIAVGGSVTTVAVLVGGKVEGEAGVSSGELVVADDVEVER